MKITRYENEAGEVGYGAVEGGETFRIDGDIYGDFTVTGERVAVRKTLAPIAVSQIIGIGLNYRHHAVESNMAIPQYPVVFMKALGAVQNPGDPIVLPAVLASDEVDYECELAIVIGKPCRNVTRANALDFVLGYTCANDVSARDWQIKRGGSQWVRGKSFDTFCPLGPVLVTADEITNPNALRISTTLNGNVMQDWSTDDMIFDVPTLIEFLSSDTTLPPGTVILTGTPHGVGMAQKPPRWLAAGDSVTVEIEGIGKLVSPVVAG
ncbi:MAG TPA: fumarylacetoacetate hydrolase family protein [Capsulimonadaceae bacterium]|jgi:2-keto-4-pentenoate hydratase/2-oxohepta-3-ene-1,7-dioic acid hydratase in catechol pathway